MMGFELTNVQTRGAYALGGSASLNSLGFDSMNAGSDGGVGLKGWTFSEVVESRTASLNAFLVLRFGRWD